MVKKRFTHELTFGKSITNATCEANTSYSRFPSLEVFSKNFLQKFPEKDLKSNCRRNIS